MTWLVTRFSKILATAQLFHDRKFLTIGLASELAILAGARGKF